MKSKHTLQLNDSVVEVFSNPGPAQPLRLTEEEACQRLLSWQWLFDACEEVNRAHHLWADTTALLEKKFASLQATIEKAVEAVHALNTV